jgi:hypothetical protein
MALNQPRPDESVRVPAQFLVDADQWARFDAVARAQNRSRSAQVRELIRREVEAFDASDVDRAA